MDEPTVQELLDLSGRVVLITGATGYLGSAMSRALAEAGASVLISSRDRGRAEDAAKLDQIIGALGGLTEQLTEQMTERVYSIPWFKHYRPEIIKEHAEAFRKVVTQAGELK